MSRVWIVGSRPSGVPAMDLLSPGTNALGGTGSGRSAPLTHWRCRPRPRESLHPRTVTTPTGRVEVGPEGARSATQNAARIHRRPDALSHPVLTGNPEV